MSAGLGAGSAGCRQVWSQCQALGRAGNKEQLCFLALGARDSAAVEPEPEPEPALLQAPENGHCVRLLNEESA